MVELSLSVCSTSFSLPPLSLPPLSLPPFFPPSSSSPVLLVVAGRRPRTSKRRLARRPLGGTPTGARSFFIRPQGTVFLYDSNERKDRIAARLGHYHRPAVYDL